MYKKFVFFLLLLMASISVVAAQEATEAPTIPYRSNYKSEVVMERIFITSIVWASDGRMFWTEKDGIVGTMSPDGVIQEDPVVSITVQAINEQGLLSIALDPKFDENHFFYVFYTMPPDINNPSPGNVIVRYTYEDGAAASPVQLYRIDIPKGDGVEFRDLHNGGRLLFGPKDGFLYVSLGDLGIREAGQDFNVPSGKIHRFLVSGTTLIPAPGNPFPGNSTWISGVRNTFSFTFDPLTGLFFATENGPDCDDEINLIIPGQNYGWSADINCDSPIELRQASGIKPMISWTPTIAPTGIMLYDGDVFPDWKGKLFYCAWKPEEMGFFELNEKHTQFVGEAVIIELPGAKKCSIELAQGPDGLIYYSNLTGMYRLEPLEEE
jgi:aldose sugar dehydrogenase